MKEWLEDLWLRIKEDAAKAHKSWTMVLNAASGTLASVWLYLLSNPDALAQIQGMLPQLGELLNPKTLTIITLGINMINMVLRFKTSGRLADK